MQQFTFSIPPQVINFITIFGYYFLFILFHSILAIIVHKIFYKVFSFFFDLDDMDYDFNSIFFAAYTFIFCGVYGVILIITKGFTEFM